MKRERTVSSIAKEALVYLLLTAGIMAVGSVKAQEILVAQCVDSTIDLDTSSSACSQHGGVEFWFYIESDLLEPRVVHGLNIDSIKVTKSYAKMERKMLRKYDYLRSSYVSESQYEYDIAILADAQYKRKASKRMRLGRENRAATYERKVYF